MTDDPRDRNCLPPVCSEVRYMTMILEKQELFHPSCNLSFELLVDLVK
jgi:hypothetical protein